MAMYHICLQIALATKKLNVNNNTGTWSIGGEYIMTDLINLNGMNFNLILSNDIGGFYGKDYRELSLVLLTILH